MPQCEQPLQQVDFPSFFARTNEYMIAATIPARARLIMIVASIYYLLSAIQAFTLTFVVSFVASL